MRTQKIHCVYRSEESIPPVEKAYAPLSHAQLNAQERLTVLN